MKPGYLWLKILEAKKQGISCTWHKYFTSPKIFSHYQNQFETKQLEKCTEVTLHVLTGRDNWQMTLWMLASWHYFTKLAPSIFIHDDGTLTNQEADWARDHIPNAIVLMDSQTSTEMKTALAEMPRCLAYRNSHPLSRKAFDVAHYSNTDKLILIDSDVLFFQVPYFVKYWIRNKNQTSWFNKDPFEPSPICTYSCLNDFGFKLWSQVNSGLCLLQRKLVDYGKMEQYLSHHTMETAKPWRIEQTLLALLASEKNKGGILGSQYTVELDTKPITQPIISRHYIGEIRTLFFSEGIPKIAKAILN